MVRDPRPEAATPTVGAVAPLSEAVITWRLDAVAKALGVSRRSLERLRSAGRFPRPMHIGKTPLWKPETIRAWVEGGGQ